MSDDIRELKRTLENIDIGEVERESRREIARIAVEGYYDFQKVRQSMMNRIRDVIRKKREGIPFDEKEDEKERKDYSKEYKDANLPNLIEKMYKGEDEKFNEQEVHDEFSKREYEYLSSLLEIAHESKKTEKGFKKPMSYFKDEPIYQQFLKYVKGVGTVMVANLFKRIGYCEDHGPHVSNLWSYAGLAPGQERKKGEKAGYNVELRTLLWKISTQLIMGGSLYKDYFYDPYKAEQMNKLDKVQDKDTYVEEIEVNGNTIPATFDSETDEMLFKGTAPSRKGHADERAKRYMIKKFAKHYWVIARKIKGLEITDPWPVKMGEHEKREDSPENPYWMLNRLREENG